ncbi:MAG: AraC family transcriptional regulator [Bacilli bacterium]|nr:AraC family transcriptional regulator [Bacilli bacterium]
MNPRLITREYKLDKVIDIESISSIYIFHFDNSYFTEFETHPQLELIYVDDGIEEVFEDDKTYQLSKGQAFIHKPLASHKDRCVTDKSTVYILSFRTSSPSMNQLFDRVLDLSKTEVNQLKQVFEIYIKNVDCNIDQYFSERKIIVNSNSFGISQIIKNIFELFFISLLNPKENEPLENHTYNDTFVNKVIQELNKAKYEKFSLEKVSKNVSYSKSYLCRHFKKVTGITIINYFYSLKIEEAKKLLLNGEHSIEETSDLLNFDSVQYFSKVFKKYSGLSPSNWRTISSKRMYF